MAENERIITSGGSKRSSKSIPSGHDSFLHETKKKRGRDGEGGRERARPAETKKRRKRRREEKRKKGSRKRSI